MRTRIVLVFTALFGLVMVWSTPVRASHHLWKLAQIFSNASGSVQFVQLFTSADGEPNVGAFSVTTSNGHTFNFVNNLPSSTTANTWILLATSNFASLPGGVAPDYVIPANFFPTGGGTLTYAGLDAWSYGAVPSDGVHSLMRDGTTAVNSPINFAAQSGSVNLAPVAPALPSWGLALLVGATLFIGAGLLKRSNPKSSPA